MSRLKKGAASLAGLLKFIEMRRFDHKGRQRTAARDLMIDDRLRIRFAQHNAGVRQLRR